MKKTILISGLIIAAIVITATTFKFSIEIGLRHSGPSSDYWSAYAKWDERSFKVVDTKVYSVPEKYEIYLRNAINRKALFVDIAWSDDLINITSLVDILNNPEYADQDDVKIIIVLSGFDQLQAEMFKHSYSVPYAVYTTKLRARKRPFQEGPKLFTTSDKYEMSNKYIHKYNQPEQLKEYLDKVVLGVVIAKN